MHQIQEYNMHKELEYLFVIPSIDMHQYLEYNIVTG